MEGLKLSCLAGNRERKKNTVMKIIKHLLNFLKGIIIGIATLVPGVSGGTMAIILNVYDDLIHAISSFFKDWKKNTLLLLVIGAGAVLSMFALAGVLESLLGGKYRVPLIYFFIGVVISGIPVILNKVTESGKPEWIDYLFALLGLGIAIALGFQPAGWLNLASETGTLLSFVYLFVVGIFVAIALILPGISTSLFLYGVGLYDPLLAAFKARNFGFLLPVILGVAAGTIGTTKILENFMQKKPRPTYMMVLGFVLGSLSQVMDSVNTDLKFYFLALAAGYFIIWVMRQNKRVAAGE